MDFEYIKKCINENSETKYKEFSSKLVPNIDNIIGVRLPYLRKLANEISSSEIAEYFLYNYKEEYFEETMLKGFVIGYIKCDINKKFEYIDFFVPKINCWSICDSFCSTLKFVNKNKYETYDYLKKYRNSYKEYDNRFITVMYMTYFSDENYIYDILEYFNNVKSQEYYSQMAIAWALSKFYFEFNDLINKYLLDCNLSDFTYNKTIQKIIESKKITNSQKEYVISLRRK